MCLGGPIQNHEFFLWKGILFGRLGRDLFNRVGLGAGLRSGKTLGRNGVAGAGEFEAGIFWEA